MLHYTKLERPGKNKHSSLLGQFVSYEEKSVVNTAPQMPTKIFKFFVQLAFNLSNRVIDTLESSSILIYSKSHMGLYTQMVGKMPH